MRAREGAEECRFLFCLCRFLVCRFPKNGKSEHSRQTCHKEFFVFFVFGEPNQLQSASPASLLLLINLLPKVRHQMLSRSLFRIFFFTAPFLLTRISSWVTARTQIQRQSFKYTSCAAFEYIREREIKNDDDGNDERQRLFVVVRRENDAFTATTTTTTREEWHSSFSRRERRR